MPLEVLDALPEELLPAMPEEPPPDEAPPDEAPPDEELVLLALELLEELPEEVLEPARPELVPLLPLVKPGSLPSAQAESVQVKAMAKKIGRRMQLASREVAADASGVTRALPVCETR
jgi:hypothetical protein